MRIINVRIIIGLAIVIAGAVMLLESFGYAVEVKRFWDYWPVIPLLIGLNWIILAVRAGMEKREQQKAFFPWGQFITGLALTTAGLLYLGRNLGYIDPAVIRQFWTILLPVLLILVGLNLLRGKSTGNAGGRVAIMGGIDAGKTPWKLEDSSYLALMGGIDLDLTTAEIPPGETVLDLTAIMGGIDIKIPSGLAVVYEGSAVLGGITFLGHEDGGLIAGRKIEHNTEGEENNPVVRLQARAIMGGIDIKEK